MKEAELLKPAHNLPCPDCADTFLQYQSSKHSERLRVVLRWLPMCADFARMIDGYIQLILLGDGLEVNHALSGSLKKECP